MENDAPEFYSKFASKYDVMVPDRYYDKILPFFTRIFEKHQVKSILDCSCGTGKHLVRFSQKGYDVAGSDISVEMINKARRNAEASHADLNFVQADFKRLPETFDRKFDCVICWGNSLSHELREEGIRSALRSMYGVLKDKGIVIIDIRNLSKWVREGTRIFPTHYHKEPNGDRKVLIYVLDFYRNRVRFNVVSFLELGGKPKFDVDSVDYRVVPAKRLKELVTETGFKQARIYGDKFAKFNERSEHIIVLATK